MRTHGLAKVALILAGLAAIAALSGLQPKTAVEAQVARAVFGGGLGAVSIPVPQGWTTAQADAHSTVTSPDGRLEAHILSGEAHRLDDIGPAVLAALGRAGVGLTKTDTIPVDDTDLVAVLFAAPRPAERAYAICTWRGDALQALVFRGTVDAFRRHIEQVYAITGGLAVEGRGPVVATSLVF